jgi:sulfur carrier protein ThiS
MFRVTVVAGGRLAKNSRIQMDGLEVTLPEGGRVRDLLVEVGVFDEEVREVIINGRRGRLDQALHRDDKIELRA